MDTPYSHNPSTGNRIPDRISLKDIEEARLQLNGKILKTPLVPLNLESPHGQIYLKLENLQRLGSFKVRGAYNVVSHIPTNKLGNGGVYTTSTGNFAQGFAWSAKEKQLRCTVLLPDNVPKTKTDAIEQFSAHIIKLPYDDWWRAFISHHYDGMDGVFVHPEADRYVIAGNGTVGLEIYEDLPEVDAVIVPYGGGSLTCGIGSALAALKPSVKVYTCEVDTASPLKTSIDLGQPSTFNYKPSFVDGIGGKSILPEMWPLVHDVVTDSLVVSLEDVANAVKLLAEKQHVIAEGAGAASLAAALSGKVEGNIVCVISGGNIDTDKLVQILNGKVPS